jgi:hypothetical protein
MNQTIRVIWRTAQCPRYSVYYSMFRKYSIAEARDPFSLGVRAKES